MQNESIFLKVFLSKHNLDFFMTFENELNLSNFYINRLNSAVNYWEPLQVTDFLVVDPESIQKNKILKKIIESHTNNGGYIIYFEPAEGTTLFKRHLQIFKENVLKNFVIVSCASFNSQNFKDFLLLNHLFYSYTTYDWNLSCCSQYSEEVINARNKKYSFNLLNMKYRYHRSYIVDKLKENKSLDNAVWSQVYKGIYLADEMNDAFHKAQTRQSDGSDKVKINPLLYLQSYFSVVTETNYEHQEQFFTEKITKPLLMGHPFVVVANKNFYKFLHNEGFKTFNNLIDESFDSIDNHQDRFNRIAEVIKELVNSDLNQFLTETEAIVRYNKDLLLEKAENYFKNLNKDVVNFLNRVKAYH